jgi:hypothetical protein
MNVRITLEVKKLEKANDLIDLMETKFNIFLQHYNDRENPEIEEGEKISTDVINKIIDEVKSF